jgi:hypothetical protein
MGERTAPQDSQIDLEQRKIQAAEFMGIVIKTAKNGSPQRTLNGDKLNLIIEGVSVSFETEQLESGVQAKVVIDRQVGLQSGMVTVFKTQDGVIVRDFAFYDDNDGSGSGGSRLLAELMPDIKAGNVDAGIGEKLMDFVKSPFALAELVPQLIIPSTAEREVLEARATNLSARNEKSRERWLELRKRVQGGIRRRNPGFISDDHRDEF